MDINFREAETTISESTTITHRSTGVDECVLSIGGLDFWHTGSTRERLQHKLIREWVTNGWGDDAAEMLAAELAKLPGAPEPFPAVLGGGS